MTFDELENELSNKLMNGEISPDEYVKKYNDLMEEYSRKHSEPIRPHEHI